jgi:hypothetical protein
MSFARIRFSVRHDLLKSAVQSKEFLNVRNISPDHGPIELNSW